MERYNHASPPPLVATLGRLSDRQMTAKSGEIRIGIGGWTFEPWRGVFYPKGLPHAQELAYASQRLTSIEVNGTFYRTQTPATFRKWASEVPAGFVFAIKGPRFATNRRVLAEAGESITRFFDSGVTELKEKLGPINWQFMATKKFDPADFGAFLKLLPRKVNGQAIRHVVEVRHDSFKDNAFIALCRKEDVGIVFAADSEFPLIADVTGDFVYARLQRGKDTVPTAYPPKELDAWSNRLQLWSQGKSPADLPNVDPKPKSATKAKAAPRDVFAYVIHEGKVRAPAGAMELIKRLKS